MCSSAQVLAVTRTGRSLATVRGGPGERGMNSAHTLARKADEATEWLLLLLTGNLFTVGAQSQHRGKAAFSTRAFRSAAVGVVGLALLVTNGFVETPRGLKCRF